MVHSTWGTWFVQDEVEAFEPDGVAIWYLGCNGFILRSSEATVYIDPYFADGDPPNLVRMAPVPMDSADASLCDAVLVSHEHIDHIHPPSYAPLVNDLGAEVFAPEAAYEEPDYEGDLQIPEGQRNVVDRGAKFEVGDFTIHVRAAHDPDAIEPVSYLIEHDAGTFFHGGDSRPNDVFEDIGDEFDIDLGVFALGTVGTIAYPDEGEARPTRWYSDENQVIEAANQLQLDRLAPSHYDMWRGVTADPKGLHEHAASFAYPRVIEQITIGDRLALGEAGIQQAVSLQQNGSR